MAYREDLELEFLQHVTSKDLDALVWVLTKDKYGNVRLTEGLTNSEKYKIHSPNHKEYWYLIAAELQCFGANSLVTMCRGGCGVHYYEVLTDACDKLKVDYSNELSVSEVEMRLLMKLLNEAMKKMSPAELKELVDTFGLKTTNFTAQAVTVALQGAINLSGFMAYQVAVIVANAVAKAIVGRGLTIAANASLTRVMGMFAGPIGWVLTGLWTVIDIAGPAYRVTLPAVVQVAFLRSQHINATEIRLVQSTEGKGAALS